MTNIEKALKGAHVANIVHFPNALHIERKGDKWTVTILKDGSEAASGKNSHAGGPTPEAAIEALIVNVHKALQDRTDRARRDALSASEDLAALGVAP